MHVEILQEHLLSALNQLQKTLPTKPQLPILSSIMLSVKDNSIQFFATDLFFGMQTTVAGKVIEEGITAIPGKIFRDYIASLSPGKISLKLNDTSLKIESSGNTTTIQCASAEEFPEFPEIEGEELSFKTTQLQDIETLVRFSASLDPTRPVLTTLLLRSEGDNLEVVSTDGFRLSTLQLKDTQVALKSPLLIPAKAFSEIVRISIQVQVEELTFIVAEKVKQLLFIIGNTKLFIRLIEGEYPPYHKIIPAEFTTQGVVDGKELEEQVKRAVIFSRDTANIIKFSIQGGELTISATSPSFGTHEGVISIEMKKGVENTIAFNARYVLDFLTTVKPEKVEFNMNEPLTPALFRPSGKSEYSYIIMPFRVNE